MQRELDETPSLREELAPVSARGRMRQVPRIRNMREVPYAQADTSRRGSPRRIPNPT